MGGDCSHYAGMLRPTKHVPMPEIIPADQLDAYYPQPCPCSAFTLHHPKADAGTGAEMEARLYPFYDVSRSPKGAYEFGDLAQDSVDKVKVLDAQDGIFICLAHDCSLVDILPLYNDDPTASINDWRSRGYKEKTRWAFLNELPKDGMPGRPPLAEGLWRNGNKVVYSEKQGFLEHVDGKLAPIVE